MLNWTSTAPYGKLPKTLVNVHSTFCEGYGNGFIGTVIKSPYKHLIGKTVKVDGRFDLLSQYAKPIK